MEYTRYFLSTRERADRAVIELEWIETVINNPLREEVQRDGRVRLWAYIAEVDKHPKA